MSYTFSQTRQNNRIVYIIHDVPLEKLANLDQCAGYYCFAQRTSAFGATGKREKANHLVS